MRDDSVESIRARNKAVEAELMQFRERLEALRTKYDRYFMGLERIPPERMRSDLERDLRNSKLENSHKTAIKFRFGNIRSRLNTYKRYWDRIMRMIEEGRFRRERGALENMAGAQRTPKPAAAPLRKNARRDCCYHRFHRPLLQFCRPARAKTLAEAIENEGAKRVGLIGRNEPRGA